MKVLFISPDPGVHPDWGTIGGESVELIREGSLPGGETRLRAERVDAVVVDETIVAGEGPDLERLQRRTDGAPVLVLGDPDDGILDGLNGTVEGVVPTGAPPVVQAALLRAAVEQARLAGRLERMEARFRDVIERNADAIVVVCKEGVVRFANAAAEELFGSSREELVGSPLGYPLTVGETTEVDIMRKGSSPVVVELRVVESEWDGEFACIVSLRDITSRKRAEENARRLIRARAARSAAELSARRFRFLAEATTVLTSSLEYEQTLAALARLCVAEIADWAIVYMRDDEERVHRLEVAHRDSANLDLVRELRETPIPPGGRNPVHRVLETGRPVRVEVVRPSDLEALAEDSRHLQLLQKLGVTSYMLVPLTARGRSLGAIGLVCSDPARSFEEQDLALAEGLASRAALAVDNARLYQEAREATRAKSDLLAIISHDLRTPLNSIIGYSELLMLGVPEPLSPGTRERIERMRAGAQQLLHLINQLLTLSRLDAGREEVHLEDLDVIEVVEEVGMVIEPLALERRIGFRVETPPHPVILRTDRGKLRQVLMNLAANAVKFTDEGEVTVLAREGDDGVEVLVQDTGPGIAPEHRDRIFEPFWQVDAADRHRASGTGLGLSVVRRLVELMGGQISVESELGRGSTFSVAFRRS